MNPTAPVPARQIRPQMRPPLQRKNSLLSLTLQLQAEVAALTEDNKQLRAALSIYREVARRSQASQPTGCRRVA